MGRPFLPRLPCSVPGCDRLGRGHGEKTRMCLPHYKRLWRGGEIGAPEIKRPAESAREIVDRFIDRSGGPDACHPWTGRINDSGYGVFDWRGRIVRAHRWVLAEALGRPLWRGEFACHHCDNPPCCNPQHLYAGTAATNSRDMSKRGRGVYPLTDALKAKTHCVRGHEFTPENLYRLSGRSERRCRQCAIQRRRDYYRRLVGRPVRPYRQRVA